MNFIIFSKIVFLNDFVLHSDEETWKHTKMVTWQL